jgi:hypothetical protein
MLRFIGLENKVLHASTSLAATAVLLALACTPSLSEAKDSIFARPDYQLRYGNIDRPSTESMLMRLQPITHNSTANAAVGSGQIFVTVTDPVGTGNVLFTFYNSGSQPSSITDVYFDDGRSRTLQSIDAIYNSLGVRFLSGAGMRDLPGAGSNFTTTPGLSAGSEAPVQPYGVNPGESFSIQLKLQSGMQYSNVLADIHNGDLRVGVNVQGFQTAGSESYVAGVTIIPEMPEPSTLAFCALGTLLIAARRRRKLQREAR